MKKTIKIDEKDLVVKKIPIGKYPELIKAIKRLPKHLQTFESLEVDKLVEKLPDIASDALPDLLGIISIAVETPVEEVNEWGLDDIVRVVTALYEVNNYKEVYAVVKKALAHPSVKKLSQQASPKKP